MKRKASKALPRTAVKEPEIASIVTPIVANGDLQLDFTKDLAEPLGLLVSRTVLCLASPVFKAMLGDDSPFREAASKTLNTSGIQVVRLDDDNFTVMQIIMNIIHFQSQNVPPTLLFPQLDLCACLCDKYDMVKSLGHWPDIWMIAYLPKVTMLGFERWLFISIIFKEIKISSQIRKHLTFHMTLSDTGELLYNGSPRFSEGVAASVITSMARRRKDVVQDILLLCWRAMLRLRDHVACSTRTIDGVGSQVEDCEAVNIGCLSREFPDLCDPADSAVSDRRSIADLQNAVNRIRHLEEMANLDPRFVRQHKVCGVGHLLQRNINASLVYFTETPEVQSRSKLYRPRLPVWFNTMLTTMQSNHPDARLQGDLYKIQVPHFTESVFAWSDDVNKNPSNSLEMPQPALTCVDCAKAWIFPGPENMGTQIEDHLRTDQHKARVAARLDEEWETARRREIENPATD